MVKAFDFKYKFKKVVANNFNLSSEETDRFEEDYGLFKELTKQLLAFLPPLSGMPILDVGCGTGISTKVISDSFKDTAGVCGIDISTRMLEKAKEKCPSAYFLLGDAEFLSHFFKGPFGALYYTASIFLLPNVEKSLIEASRIMFDGGIIAGSYLETIEDREGENLIAFARTFYPDLGIRQCRLFSFYDLTKFFQGHFRDVIQEDLRFSMKREEIEAFFLIPAQSASLFPGLPLERRQTGVQRLFETLGRDQYVLLWKLIGGKKL
ncbi:MAG: methyltransferase domain-containing protein [Thermodesulfobacteriota bacterium]|nr:methyltransferase domain-containing protein [Thermodesulfobacteriota bacterium]